MASTESINSSVLWRTDFDPLPDITAYELALDQKFVNASQIVFSYNCEALGGALRHRVCSDTKRRMDVVWAEARNQQKDAGACAPT